MKQVLVVVSKVKDFIKNTSGMNTSDGVKHALTEIIEKACQKAIENAQADGRKTVMERDFDI
jgi:histone H3/H4